MKGLLMKDLKLMKAQKSFLIVIAFLCVWFAIAGRKTSFVLAYVSAMVSLFVVTTVGYDEHDNGMGFLFTMPISRKLYVLEKYVFGMLLMAAACIVGVVLVFAQTALRQASSNPMEEFFMALMIPIIMVSLVMSVMLPLQLKFGSERSRMAMVIGIAFMSVVVYGVRSIQKTVKIVSIDFMEVVQQLSQATEAQVAACICALSVAMLGISYGISVAVMKGKQF
ncbi:MAG: ABC-2 transporter permease [Eubacterium sp.]|nr:ABC-2 transporter permease [Eubacterium sp.]